jgi:SAM-dependent methyltransferase
VSGRGSPPAIALEEALCPRCGIRPERRVRLARSWLDDHPPSAFEVRACPGCDLWVTTPRPTAGTLAAAYPAGYHRVRVRDSSLPRPVSKRGTLLDVGCGVGDGMALARAEGWSCTGIEVSDEAASVARARGFDVIVGDAAEVELPGERFDHVRCWHTVEHVHDPIGLLERLRDAVKPDGTISVMLPNRHSATAAIFRNRWYHLDLPRHLHHFRPADVRAAAHQAGLTVVAVRHTASPSGLLGSLDCSVAGAGTRLRSNPRWRRVARLAAWGFARARRGDVVEYTLTHPDPPPAR